MGKIYLIFVFLTVSNVTFCQNKEVLNWINNHAYSIEDCNFNTNLNVPNNQLSSSFYNASVFGFGEATHHSKEFIQLKSKFFKYLVLHHNVKIFVLEESFGASFFVNEYINGKGGDLKEILGNFKQGIWKTQDLYELIDWMKSYNEDKSIKDKIKFFGNDCMFNFRLVFIINKIVSENGISLNSEEKELLKFYETEIWSYKDKKLLESNAVEITKLKERLKTTTNNVDLINTFNALEQFNEFLIHSNQQVRDKNMASNVINLQLSLDSKVFICAHNVHVKKTNVEKNIPSMGKLLFEKYNNLYFSVGFEFGKGTLVGFDSAKEKFEDVILDEPIKETNSAFFFETNKDIFYFDFSIASEDVNMRKFLNEKRNFIFGGYGLVLKYLKHNIVSEKYTSMFDGLIYVKNISKSNQLQH